MPEYQRIRRTHFFVIVHHVSKSGFYGLGPGLAKSWPSVATLVAFQSKIDSEGFQVYTLLKHCAKFGEVRRASFGVVINTIFVAAGARNGLSLFLTLALLFVEPKYSDSSLP